MTDTQNQGFDPSLSPKSRLGDLPQGDIYQLLEDQQSELKQLRTELKETIKAEALNTARQLEAFHQLHCLVGDVPDLLHGWPISPDFALKLVRQIKAKDYDLIVEFGSGISTYLELKSLESKQQHSKSIAHIPQLIVFEHLETYLQQTQELIVNCPLRQDTDLALRPLEAWQDESGNYSFYSGTEIIANTLKMRHARKILYGKMDASPLKMLVVIDGPPGTTCHWARYPAVPIILDTCIGLSVDIDFLLDDVIRFDERDMAEAWENILHTRNLPYTRQDLDYEKGGLLIHVSSLGEHPTGDSVDSVAPHQLLAHNTGQDELLRQLEVLEQECDRRYAALRLCEEQAITIARLQQKLETASQTEEELRTQLGDQINALTELGQALEQATAKQEEQVLSVPLTPSTNGAEDMETTIGVEEMETEIGKLRDENLLLRLQIKQVQDELEHYVNLTKEKDTLGSKAWEDSPPPQPADHRNRKDDKDIINANRALLQTPA